MKRYQLIAALAAFIITFILCTVLKGCTVKAGAKQKEEATGGARPLAGLSLYLQKAAEKNVNILKILLERWQQEQDDINLLAEVIYHENWHTDKEKLTAYYTGAVVMNRVHSKEWPNTVKEVLYQKGQYSTTKKFYTVELPEECYEMARNIYRNGTPDVPKEVVFQSMNPKLGSKVWKSINGEYFAYG